MITGATRGAGGGDALARHLLKGENEPTAIPARGLGAEDLRTQLRELLAISVGGRTDRPFYHVHCIPDPATPDNAAARARFWSLFEAEFGMGDQPFCGVEHRKGGRVHEHRVYGLVRPSGAVVDLSWDFPRREKCARIIEFEAGLPAVPSKHARSVAERLKRDGRSDVADWLVASGTTTAPRPVAPLTPRERLVGERTGVALDDVRRAALSAWRDSADAAGFVAALRARGLDIRPGRSGFLIVDGSGTVHLATRLLGAAARRFEGERIVAAAVKARLGELRFKGGEHERSGDHATLRGPGAHAANHHGGAVAPGGGRVGIRRLGGDLGRPDGGGGRGDASRSPDALQRLRATSCGVGVVLQRRLSRLDISLNRYAAAVERARWAAARIHDAAEEDDRRGLALWGLKDIWGLPLR